MTDVDVQHISNDTKEPDLAEETIALVRHWLTESAKVPADRAATRSSPRSWCVRRSPLDPVVAL